MIYLFCDNIKEVSESYQNDYENHPGLSGKINEKSVIHTDLPNNLSEKYPGEFLKINGRYGFKRITAELLIKEENNILYIIPGVKQLERPEFLDEYLKNRGFTTDKDIIMDFRSKF